MTFQEARDAALKGAKITHPGMGKGWTLQRLTPCEELYCVNPHTGSNYLFTPMYGDDTRTDWRIVRG